MPVKEQQYRIDLFILVKYDIMIAFVHAFLHCANPLGTSKGTNKGTSKGKKRLSLLLYVSNFIKLFSLVQIGVWKYILLNKKLS